MHNDERKINLVFCTPSHPNTLVLLNACLLDSDASLCCCRSSCLPLPLSLQFIQCFGCLNVSAMVAIIVYVIVNNVDLGGDPEDPPPDPSA